MQLHGQHIDVLTIKKFHGQNKRIGADTGQSFAPDVSCERASRGSAGAIAAIELRNVVSWLIEDTSVRALERGGPKRPRQRAKIP